MLDQPTVPARARTAAMAVGLALVLAVLPPSSRSATADAGAETTSAAAAPRARTSAEQRAEAVIFAVTNQARLGPRQLVPEAKEPAAPPLRGWTDLRDVARGWSDRMAADGRLSHNGAYASQLCCWAALGENVGVVSGVGERPTETVARDLAMQLLRSPSHRKAALDPRYDEVGVGVSIRGARMYVTVDLRRRQAGTTPPGGPYTPAVPTGPDPTIAAACPGVDSLPQPFTDVGGGPHEQPIACAVAWEVVAGRSATTYAPARAVTRGQVASILHRLLSASGARFDEGARVRFRDVGPGPHRDAIERLAGAGIINGVGGGRFDPEAPVRRDQLASLVVRGLDRAHGVVPALGPSFPDVAGGSTHGAAVRRLVGAGITQGDAAGRFQPGASVRRDQMATFAMRTADLLVRLDHTEPPPEARP